MFEAVTDVVVSGQVLSAGTRFDVKDTEAMQEYIDGGSVKLAGKEAPSDEGSDETPQTQTPPAEPPQSPATQVPPQEPAAGGQAPTVPTAEGLEEDFKNAGA